MSKKNKVRIIRALEFISECLGIIILVAPLLRGRKTKPRTK